MYAQPGGCNGCKDSTEHGDLGPQGLAYQAFEQDITYLTTTHQAGLQVIRDTTAQPFRCLDTSYRRELARVYIANVETLCRRFIDERRAAISAALGADSSAEAQEAFQTFWRRLPADRRAALLQVLFHP